MTSAIRRGWRVLAVLGLVCVGYSASATQYVLTVQSGVSNTLDKVFAEAYPGVTLAAEDKIVKNGPGILVDSAAALPIHAKLTFVVQEGALIEGLARTNSLFSVSNGASVVITKHLGTLRKAQFKLAGSGTSMYKGALCLLAGTGTSDAHKHWMSYELLDDAVIYINNKAVNFTGESAADTKNNIFKCNGHTLTFRQPQGTNYVRFRFAGNFVDPATVVLDGCGFSHSPGHGVYVRTADGTATRIPRLKLVNGAFINCVDQKLMDAIAVLDCEPGTMLKTFNESLDKPSACTLACLQGCPMVGSGQNVSVAQYVARADDLQNDCILTNAGTLAIGRVEVDRPQALALNTPYTLVTTQDDGVLDVTDATFSDYGTEYMTLAKTETTLSVTKVKDFPTEGVFTVCVPAGDVWNFAAATNGHELADLSGKKLLKMGGGTLNVNVVITNCCLTELEVAEGTYYLGNTQGAPTTDTKRIITVRKGGTVESNIDFYYSSSKSSFATSGRRAEFHLAGTGVDGQGALQLMCHPGNNTQYVNYFLDDDTVIGVGTGGICTFSGETRSDFASNRFYLNGHDLTFKELKDGSYVRFRHTVTFHRPGVITFDGCNVTHLAGATVNVYATDDSKQPSSLPLVKMENKAKFNGVDDKFASKIAVLDFAAGTTIGKVDDAPESYTLPCLRGCPAISFSSGQTITLQRYEAKAADLLAERVLDGKGSLAFDAGAKIDVADLGDLSLVGDFKYPLVKNFTGRAQRGTSLAGQPVSLLYEAEGPQLSLVPRRGSVLLVR